MAKQENSGSKGSSNPLAPPDSLIGHENSGETFYSPTTTPPETSPPNPEVKPLAETVKPLTSTSLFSPPPFLPPVVLPPHPPLSPIQKAPESSESDYSLLTGPNQLLNLQLQHSSVEAWLNQVPSSPSIEWDPYSVSPSFCQEEQFWSSRQRVVSTTQPYFLSDSSGIISVGRKVQLVSTQSSDLESLSEMSIKTMAEAGKTNDQFELASNHLNQQREMIKYKMRAFTVDDVEADDTDLAHEKVNEVNDLFCSYWAGIDTILANFKEIISPEGVKALQDSIPQIKAEV